MWGKHNGKSKPSGREFPSNRAVQGIISMPLGDERCRQK